MTEVTQDLGKCKKCGAQLEVTLPYCPKCGYTRVTIADLKEEPWYKGKIPLIILVTLAIVVLLYWLLF